MEVEFTHPDLPVPSLQEWVCVTPGGSFGDFWAVSLVIIT